MEADGPAAVAPEWTAEDEFTIDGVDYSCRPMSGMFESTPTRFCLRKPPRLVQRLADLLRADAPRNAVELGIYEGGSAGFIAQAAAVEKLVCFDIERAKPALETMLVAKGLDSRVRPHWEVDQADGDRLREITRGEVGDAPLDLVIDDASHLLGPTRASFEALFPMLRPGGTFLIEDWAWAHGITNAWPRRTPLTVLVFELLLANAHRPEAVARIDVDRDWTLVTRGPAELDDDFNLIEACGERGRALLPPPGAGTEQPRRKPTRASRMRRRLGRLGSPDVG